MVKPLRHLRGKILPEIPPRKRIRPLAVDTNRSREADKDARDADKAARAATRKSSERDAKRASERKELADACYVHAQMCGQYQKNASPAVALALIREAGKLLTAAQKVIDKA